MSELRGVNTGLNFELLNGVNGGEDDIGIEFGSVLLTPSRV